MSDAGQPHPVGAARRQADVVHEAGQVAREGLDGPPLRGVAYVHPGHSDKKGGVRHTQKGRSETHRDTQAEARRDTDIWLDVVATTTERAE